MADEPDLTDGGSRREFLTGVGATGIAALAGCVSANGNGDGGGDGSDGGNGDGSGDGSGDTLSGKITITGSSTVFTLATAVANAFEEKHPEVKISISPTGSGGGFKNHFCVGKADINNASRPIQSSEKKLCEDNGIDWHEIKVATDAVTVVVNDQADWVDCVTVEELKQIWKPDGAQKWSDVRSEWPDKEFELYGAASTSGTFDYFTEAVVGEEGEHRQDYSATEKDRTIVQGVEGSKYAMGYLGYAYYTQAKDRVKALAIDSGDGKCVKPSLETAKKGTYKPLSRPLFTYPRMKALQEKHIAEFCRFFVKKSADQELVAEQVGYVPTTQETMQSQLEDLNAAIEKAQG